MRKRNGNKSQPQKAKISKIESTDEKLTSRGGLFFLNEYIENIGIISRLSHKFKYLKDSTKGLSVENYFTQLFSFIFDGTKFNLTYFDELKKDEAYGELLNLSTDDLSTSHQIKRMTGKFKNILRHINIFRNLLLDIFINNLISEQPEVIEIGIDTMVLNNDDSKQKEGCYPTYKGVKGFQPFQVYWNGMIIDAIFRDGKCHSNHGDDVKTTLKKIIKKIRKCYSKSVPIIIKMDSGFMSDENFTYFEKILKVHFVCVGKMYDSVKDYIGELPVNNRKTYNGRHQWEYIEFGNKLKSWDKFRRAVYVQQVPTIIEQPVLDFARSDRMIYTNIGTDPEIDSGLRNLTNEDYFSAEYIIKLHHIRATDELVNRDLKEFMTKEKLPFRAFSSNQVFYYLMTIAFSVMRNFQRNISVDVLYSNSQPNSFRRLFIDIPGKIVSHSGYTILKIAKAYFEKLKLKIIYERCKLASFCIPYY
ncbi:MAG: IS1380 family transposase [Candidatus Cloacimonadota bacterium]|nr:IS1380 family transposase [Candidatus Cloacimonadota bacterium]